MYPGNRSYMVGDLNLSGSKVHKQSQAQYTKLQDNLLVFHWLNLSKSELFCFTDIELLNRAQCMLAMIEMIYSNCSFQAWFMVILIYDRMEVATDIYIVTSTVRHRYYVSLDADPNIKGMANPGYQIF